MTGKRKNERGRERDLSFRETLGCILGCVINLSNYDPN